MLHLMVYLTILFSILEMPSLCKTVEAKNTEIVTNVCADCSKYLKFCRVSKTGFKAELRKDVHKVVINSNSSTDNIFVPECVPDKFKIIDQLEGYVCFWSPKLGCHKVLGRRDQDEGFNKCSCLDCLSRCPCVCKSSPLKGQMRLILLLLSIVMGIIQIIK